MSLEKFKHWLEAARLRTLPLSMSTVFLGTAVGYYNGHFKIITFILSMLTVSGLQILSNFANDYGDYIKGTDNENRVGPKRAMQKGIIGVKDMKTTIWLTGIITFVLGVVLLWYSVGIWNIYFLLFLTAGLLSIWAAIKYTIGNRPYGYSGWGDVFVFLFFDFGIIGISFLYSKDFHMDAILPSIFSGCMATSVLNLNNMRDIDNDRQMNKKTLAVRLGSDNAKIYHTGLIFSACFAISYYISYLNLIHPYIYIVYLPIFYILYILNKILKIKNISKIDLYLKKTSIVTLMIAFLILVCIILDN